MGLVHQGLKALLSATLSPRRFLVQGPKCAKSIGHVGEKAHPVEIALTFDDGPDPQHTGRVLDLLLEAGIKATFFAIGECARRHPELIRRMVKEGHEVANHTETHSEPRKTSTRVFLDEIRRTRLLLQDLTGRDCRLVRPPKGQLTAGKLCGLLREQFTVVLWNVDPRDFAMTSPQSMRTWVEGYRPRSGDIVLLHDDRPYAAVAVEEFLRNPRLHQVRFARISEWTQSAASRSHAVCQPPVSLDCDVP